MKLERYEYFFNALGGMNELQFYAKDEETAQVAADAVVAEVKRIEHKYSRYRADSILSKINASAGKDAVSVDDETLGLLNYAGQCYVQADGLFDVSSGILRRVWDFKSAKLPTTKELKEVLPLIGWKNVEVDEQNVRLAKTGMEIDFGGIGKEYAVDRAAYIFQQHNINHGFVNLAGDIRAVGGHPDGRPWVVGLRDPRDSSNVFAGIALERGSVATSGDYERFIELNGKRYCHILNPRTGYPVEDLQAVTVIAESCLVAGSLATITMLKGEEAGSKFLKSGDVSHVIVAGNGKVSAFPKELLKKEQTELVGLGHLSANQGSNATARYLNNPLQ